MLKIKNLERKRSVESFFNQVTPSKVLKPLVHIMLDNMKKIKLLLNRDNKKS